TERHGCLGSLLTSCSNAAKHRKGACHETDTRRTGKPRSSDNRRPGTGQCPSVSQSWGNGLVTSVARQDPCRCPTLGQENVSSLTQSTGHPPGNVAPHCEERFLS